MEVPLYMDGSCGLYGLQWKILLKRMILGPPIQETSMSLKCSVRVQGEVTPVMLYQSNVLEGWKDDDRDEGPRDGP